MDRALDRRDAGRAYGDDDSVAELLLRLQLDATAAGRVIEQAMTMAEQAR